MTVGQKPVTAEESPRTLDDGLRRELVRGEVRTMAPAGSAHGHAATNVGTLLGQHVNSHRPGVSYAAGTWFEISSDPDTVRAPGVASVRRKRVEAAGEVEGYWPGAPDLAVDVVSPNDRFAEVEGKIPDWLLAGARTVLVVNSRGKSVAVRTSEREARILSEGEVIDGGEVVPGWTLPVSDVFG